MATTVPITVVIPTFNRASLLARAIHSVLAQTVLPAEVIVVDDGSTDTTAEDVRPFGPTVKYVHQENSGVSAARNRGIREAREEWIALLDSDDEWYPHKTQFQWEILQKYPHLRWCADNYDLVRGTTVCGQDPGHRNRREWARHGFLPNALRAARRGLRFHTSGMVFHRSLFDRADGFDPALSRAEDNDLWWRFGILSPAVGYGLTPCHRYYLDSADGLASDDKATPMVLASLARNREFARQAAPQRVSDFLALARGIAFRRLVHSYAHPSCLTEQDLQKHLSLFPPSPAARAVFAVTRILPHPIECWFAGFARDLHRWWGQWR